jgi:hypothetical protein
MKSGNVTYEEAAYFTSVYKSENGESKINPLIFLYFEA